MVYSSHADLTRVSPVSSTAAAAAPVVDADGATFSLCDPTGRICGVRLEQEVGLRTGLDFTRRGGAWTLRLPRPPVDRMEYLFEISDHRGKHATITDPGNPLRAGGAFGDKSVVQFPGYREPYWLTMPGVPERTQPLSVKTRARRTTMTGVLWSPEDLAADEPAPLLVVHDGPEYATLAGLTAYLGAMIAAGTMPALRAALLSPGDRNSFYSANRGYANALCQEVVPVLDELAPTTARIGLGASLGALAMLHAHRSFPETFSGLVLQSGSFFSPELDPQESGFSGFKPVTGFVAEIEQATSDSRPIPVVITCGAPEENLANNKQMVAALTGLGYPVDFHEVRDAHNYTAWRDALHPAATDLFTAVVGAHAA
jgi:enterochelin esterase-like enzyme